MTPRAIILALALLPGVAWGQPFTNIFCDVDPKTNECAQTPEQQAQIKALLDQIYKITSEPLTPDKVRNNVPIAPDRSSHLPSRSSGGPIPQLPPGSPGTMSDPSAVIVSAPDRSWHLLTQSYGGTVSLLREISKAQCEEFQGWLATANQFRNQVTSPFGPSDIKSAECFQ